MAKQTDNQVSAVRRAKHGWILTLFFSILAVFYLYPIFLVLINSLKKKGFIMKSPFALPDERSFFGMTNFVKGIEKTNFFAAFGNSVIITVGSVAVIIFCTSMCAWFITRVHNKFTMALYMLCLFSMIVPFQMVMFPLSKLANMMHLSNPIGIILVYLGFGAGLAVFMFCGFVKSIPLEIEEAAMIDGCNKGKAMWHVVIPLMRSSFVQCIFLSTTRCFMVYDLNLSLTKGEPFNQSVLAAMHVYNQAFVYKNYGTGQAEALVLFIVCAVIGMLQVYFGKKGEVAA